MMQDKKHCLPWFASGILFCLLTVIVVICGISGKILITSPEEIPETADAVINCIQKGNWELLETMVVGRPALAPDTGNANSAEHQIWNAYQKSLQWNIAEDFSVEGSHVTQKVTVTCLDISGVTDIIAEIVATSTTENNDTVTQEEILCLAAEQALSSEIPVKQHEIILTLLRANDQWLVVPTIDLRALLSGFTAP